MSNSLNIRVAKRFSDKTNHLNTTKAKIALEIVAGAEKIVATLLSENKVLICGNGSTQLLAQYSASKFINQFETLRPALPALALSSDFGLNTSNDSDEIFSRQIQALGLENDILLVFVAEELTNDIVHAIETAHEQQMQIILICGETSEDISPYLNSDDLTIQIDLGKQAQIMELQLLCIHCLCDLIDHLLFGTP
ncbi:MAG: SIS domain-containing protein [Pseudomonadota bacterium]